MYFVNRLSYYNDRLKRLHKFLKKQNYACEKCKRVFLPNDIIELHHNLNESGARTDKVLFVHGHCHDTKHR